MRIIYIADHTMPPLSDNEHIDLMNKLVKDNCNGDIFFQGRSCYDFAHLSEEGNSIVYEIDGHKAKTTFYTLTIDYGDPNYPKLHPIIRTVTNIFVGNDLWVIFSDSEDYVFEEHYDLIMDTITSLRFEQTTPEQTTPEQTTPEQTTPNETFEVTTIIGLLITLLIVASIVIPIYKKIRSSKDKAKSSKQCENCRGNWISTGTICEYCERMFNLPDNERISSSTNPYDILGISRNSSQNEIKTAYRKLIKKYDPSFGSVNRTKEEQEKFEKIGVKLHFAWEQLKRK
jgi:hypothetical protein